MAESPATNRMTAKEVVELFDSIGLPAATIDSKGVILGFNAASQRLLGGSVSKAVGKVFSEVAEPEEREFLESVLRERNATALLRAENVEWISRAKSNQFIRWINHPFTDADGRELILATGIDVTQRMRDRDALAESGAFLRAVIDASPVSVVTTNSRCEILTFSNKAQDVFGFQEEEIVGRSVAALLPGIQTAVRQDRGDHDLQAGESRVFGRPREVRALRRNGEEFPALLHITEFRDGQTIYVAFIDDITEARATERTINELRDQLNHAGRVSAMGEIATAIAHELNQPLTAAVSLLGAALLSVEKRTIGPEEFRILLEEAIGEIKRAGDIIQNTRAFIRKKSTGHTRSDLNALVRRACEIALMGGDVHHIDVEFDLEAGAVPVIADELQIQQVVVNLVRNAVDAMKDAPVRKLLVRTRRRQGGEVEFSISDTGGGIQPAVRRRLFVPFTSTKPNGLGVGLSISKSIIDAHHGEISAVENPEGGASFVVRLPGIEE